MDRQNGKWTRPSASKADPGHSFVESSKSEF